MLNMIKIGDTLRIYESEEECLADLGRVVLEEFGIKVPRPEVNGTSLPPEIYRSSPKTYSENLNEIREIR